MFLVTSVKLFTVLSTSESVSKLADQFFAVIGPDRIRNRGRKSKLVSRDSLIVTKWCLTPPEAHLSFIQKLLLSCFCKSPSLCRAIFNTNFGQPHPAQFCSFVYCSNGECWRRCAPYLHSMNMSRLENTSVA